MESRTLRTMALLVIVAVLGAPGLGLKARAGEQVPFKGRAHASITDVQGNVLQGSATGEATHLGRFFRTETLILSDDGSFTGELTFRAANGDLLHADIQGQFTSATTAEGSYTFTGGTGRFADASGEADFKAVASGPGSFLIHFDGTISF